MTDRDGIPGIGPPGAVHIGYARFSGFAWYAVRVVAADGRIRRLARAAPAPCATARTVGPPCC